jgi:cholesterol transport system auxiliary component
VGLGAVGGAGAGWPVALCRRIKPRRHKPICWREGHSRRASARRPSGKTLLVTAPKAAPGFDSNRIAYTKEPPKLDYYNNHVWSDTPAKMLLPILVRAFESTGRVQGRDRAAGAGAGQLRVDVDVIRLQQEFMTQPSRVRLTARIKVVDMKSGHVLATQVFEAVEPAPSEDAGGAARAANAAVQKVLSQMVSFTLRTLS